MRTAAAGGRAVAVIGECGAGDRQLHQALDRVGERNWRALTRWPGSYLTIARTAGTLAVIGDLSGQHPVYWRPHGAGIWWATSQTALAALDGAPVDPVALGAHLAFAQPDVLAERSLFHTVRRVPPGCLLLLDAGGARAVRYEPADPDPVDLADAAPVVRAALTEAVAIRLDGRTVSADLAGLDSTTLACLAAQHGPVEAVTFADARLRDDDLTYATRTAAAVPGLRHHPVPGSEDTVYYHGLDHLETLPATDAPNAYAITASIKRAVLNAAAPHHQGTGLHLTGAAGDGVLSAPATYLADLLRTRRYRQALAHTIAHARLRHTSPLALLRQALPASRTGLAGAWRDTARQLRGTPQQWRPQAQQPVAWTPVLACADWMPPAARAQLADALDEAADTLHQAPQQPAAWDGRQDLVRTGADICGWRELARTEHNIDLAAPYLDNEVLRAALAVPADQRGAPGRYKPLLATAFTGRGVVPDVVLARTTKGSYNAVAYAGIIKHAPVLRGLLGASSRLAALGLITPGPVGEMLQRAEARQPLAQGALHTAAAAEVWLRQHDTTTAASRWEEANRRVGAA